MNAALFARLPADPALVLRDIHVPPPPPLWPPAPGWWLLAAAILLASGIAAWFAWRRRQRRRALQRSFDDAIAAAPSASARIAAMSELLRRAAIHRDPRAATQPLFDDERDRLLLEGGFRADVDDEAAAELLPRARRRFLEWMGAA
ncbi:MAG: DUF4381 family protein [Pseudomonadota bacterium]|nr:DUF4381 family protein [Pseudomonadota bacterium]